MSTRLAVLALAASLACGCGILPTPASGSDAPDVLGKATAAQEASAIAAASALGKSARVGSDYRISPADLISVTVYDNQEMSRRARVNADGVIILPLAGAVKVGGKTLASAESLIEGKLAAFIVNPQVSLFIEEYGNKLFFVMGEVQKPGSYPFPAESRVTLLEAISTAGGFTPVAAQDRARVLRYENGESRSYTIDVRSITREGDKDKDIALQPNDVVFIPQSMF